MTNQKIVTLSIKQKWFDAIIAGEKKEEFREVTPVTEKKYIKIDSDGYAVQDKNGDVVPIKYDLMRLYSGQMKGKRPTALIEITGAKAEIMFDEDGQPVTYMFDDYEHTVVRMVYSLGRVLEVKIEE